MQSLKNLSGSTSSSRYPQKIAKRTPCESSDSKFYLQSPAVGLWLSQIQPGQFIAPGLCLGLLSILDVIHEVVAPEGTFGRVEELSTQESGLQAVAYDTKLFLLDTEQLTTASTNSSSQERPIADTANALIFRAPTSGRYYLSSGPGKPPFIHVGGIISTGHTVGLLEVMKTFNRIHYHGENLPSPVRIVKIFPENGQDLNRGDALLQLEPAAKNEEAT